jgi:glycerol-1-phosphate dehydrogenase [NAD(P)+]
VLAKLIALAGLAMSLSHATTPLSGFEHVFSHVLDMAAEARHEPLGMHGAQVAVAALHTAIAYEIVLREFEPTRFDRVGSFPDPDGMRAHVKDAFASIDASGRVAEECWTDYSVKLEAWRSQAARIPGRLADWQAIRTELGRRAWSAETMQQIMRGVGLPRTFRELAPPISEMQARMAFLTAHWIRRRFTLGDLLYFMGWDREVLWTRLSGAGAQAA